MYSTHPHYKSFYQLDLRPAPLYSNVRKWDAGILHCLFSSPRDLQGAESSNTAQHVRSEGSRHSTQSLPIRCELERCLNVSSLRNGYAIMLNTNKSINKPIDEIMSWRSLLRCSICLAHSTKMLNLFLRSLYLDHLSYNHTAEKREQIIYKRWNGIECTRR